MKITKKIRNSISKRMFITMALLILAKIGTFLPVPGINIYDLRFYLQNNAWPKSLLSTVTNKNLPVIGIFALGISPYITATIIVQFFLVLTPWFSGLKKENSLKSKRIFSRLTRLLTLLCAVIESCALANSLKQVLPNWNCLLAFNIVVWLSTGTMVLLWLSELITKYGLGNGVSLLVWINTFSKINDFFKSIENIPYIQKIKIFLIIMVLSYGIIFFQEATRYIPLVSSKQLKNSTSLNENENYIPLKLDQVGIMPLVLASSTTPNYIISKFSFLTSLNFFKLLSYIIYFALILSYSSIYSEIMLNSEDISNKLQEMAVTVPGIRPGRHLKFYLKQTIRRVTFIGTSILLIFLLAPSFIKTVLHVEYLPAASTSYILIASRNVLDIIHEMENIYYSEKYK